MSASTPGTISFADLYGPALPTRQTVTPADEQVASGKVGGSLSSKSPAISWLGMVVALVLLRLAYKLEA